MSASTLIDVDDMSLEQEIRRTGVPIVIDFWAPWCQPCKLVHPILEKMAERYGSTVKFLRMNIDKEKVKPAQYAIRSIPTLLFFKDGTIKNQLTGLQSENSIDQAIQNLL